jgi:uncharacterized OB-fold protein
MGDATGAAISDETVFDTFTGVLIDYDNIEHYRGLLQQKLLINKCANCRYWVYPHRPMCPECWSWDLQPTQVSGRGTVYLFTLLYQGRVRGSDFQEPLRIVAIELAEQPGLRYTSTVVNCSLEEMRIGMPVELTWITRRGILVPAFQPAGGGSAQ